MLYNKQKIGKYEIGETLGKGQSSTVKMAKDSENGREVAIKIMNSNDTDEWVLRLQNNEIKAL